MTLTHTAFAPLALLMGIALGACSGETATQTTEPSEISEAAPAPLSSGLSSGLSAGLSAPLSEAPSIRDVSVEAASALIAGEAPIVVLDVRTPKEFAQGHIEGAINVDAMSDTFIEDLANLNKDAAYVLHCRSGKRSAKALEAMKDANFTNIAHMNAGMNGWSEAGLPVAP